MTGAVGRDRRVIREITLMLELRQIEHDILASLSNGRVCGSESRGRGLFLISFPMHRASRPGDYGI